MEYFLAADTRLTLEVFNKEYDDMVTFEMLEGSDGRDSLNIYNIINGGSGRSNGIELFIQKNIQKTGTGLCPGPIQLRKEWIPVPINTTLGSMIMEM